MPKETGGKGRDKIDQDAIEEEYGLSYALFQAFPELKQLLNQAVKETWSPSKFQVELRQTDWFKKHSDVWREHTALKYSDPATYRERLGNSMTQVRNLAGAFGARLSQQALNRVAERALLFGMDDAQIQDILANYVKPSDAGHYGGQLSAIESNLRDTAFQNGVRVDPGQMKRWMRQIVRGDSSQEQFSNYIRDIAAKTFSAYGDQIKAGMNLSDLASPYMQSMSQVLELNPGSIDMFDPTVRRALSGVRNDKGKIEPISITDFEDTLRKDNRWQYTAQAKDQAKGYALSIARMWGLQ